MVAGHRALEFGGAAPHDLVGLLRRDHVLKLEYIRVGGESLGPVLWEVDEGLLEHAPHGEALHVAWHWVAP